MSPTTHEMQTERECLRAHFCAPSGRPLPAGPVAAGRECLAFRLWVDGLAEEGNEALLQLRQYGFTYDLAALEEQLRQALRTGPVGPISRIVAQRLLVLLGERRDAVCFLLGEEQLVSGA